MTATAGSTAETSAVSRVDDGKTTGGNDGIKDETLKAPSNDSDDEEEESSDDEGNYAGLPEDLEVEYLLGPETEEGAGDEFKEDFDKFMEHEDGAELDMTEQRRRTTWMCPFLDNRIFIACAAAFQIEKGAILDSDDFVAVFDLANLLQKDVAFVTPGGKNIQVESCPLLLKGWMLMRALHKGNFAFLRLLVTRMCDHLKVGKIVLLSTDGLDTSFLLLMLYCMMDSNDEPDGSIPLGSWGAFVRMQRMCTWVRGAIPLNGAWVKLLIVGMFGKECLHGIEFKEVFQKNLCSWGNTGVMCTIFFGPDTDIRVAMENGIPLLLLEDEVTAMTKMLTPGAKTCGFDKVMLSFEAGTLDEPIGRTLLRNARKWFPVLQLSHPDHDIPQSYFVPVTADASGEMHVVAVAMLYIAVAAHRIGDLEPMSREALLKEFGDDVRCEVIISDDKTLRLSLSSSEKRLLRLVVNSVWDEIVVEEENMGAASGAGLQAVSGAAEVGVEEMKGEVDDVEFAGEIAAGTVGTTANDESYGGEIDQAVCGLGLTVQVALRGVGVSCFQLSADVLDSQPPAFLTTRGHQFATLPCMRVAVDNVFPSVVYDYYPIGMLWHATDRKRLVMYGDEIEIKCLHKKRCPKTDDGRYACAGFVVAVSNGKPYVLCYPADRELDPDELPLVIDTTCLDGPSLCSANQILLHMIGEMQEKAGVNWFPLRGYFGTGDVLFARSLGYVVKGLIVCDVRDAIKHAKDITIPMLLVGNASIPASTPFRSPPIQCSEQVTSGKKMELFEGMDSWCEDQQYHELCKLLQNAAIGHHGNRRSSLPRCMVVFDFEEPRAAQVALCVVGILGMSLPVKMVPSAERAVTIAHIMSTRYTMYDLFKCDVGVCGEYLATSDVVSGLLEQQLAANKKGALREDPTRTVRLADEVLDEVGVYMKTLLTACNIFIVF